MEVFKLFGSIFVDTDEADKSLSKTEDKAGSLGKTLISGAKNVGKFAVGVAGVATTAAAGMVKMTTSAADAMDVIDKGSQKMGITTEAYQEWDHAMSQSGMDISVMQTGMKTLQNQMDGVTQGTKASIEAFDRLGVSVYDENGNMKDQTTMLNEVMMALAEMEDGAERTALAVDMFGKSGTEMLPLLNSGADGIQALKDEAHDLGLVFDEEAVKSGVTLGDTIANIKDAVSALGVGLGNTLVPIVQTVADELLAFLPTIQSLFYELGPIFTNILQTILPPLMSMVETILPPLITLIEALMPLFTTICDIVLPLISSLIEGISWVLSEVVIPVITVVVKAIDTAITAVIDFFKNFKTNMSNIWDKIVETFKKPINAIIGFINGLVSGVVGGVNNIIRAINKLSFDVPDWVPGIGGQTFGFNLNEITAPQIPLLAKGGTISAAGSVLVGERGPELLNLPAGASVNPLSQGSDINDINILMQKIYDELPSLIARGIDQMSINWNDREMGRMVREYAG